MGILFISHSSKNNDRAIEVRDWLRSEGWTDIFLDVDRQDGLQPGQRWQDELRRAGENCAAVLVLVSPEWVASWWCRVEFLLAVQMGKRVFPLLLTPVPAEELPVELVGEFQLADLSRPELVADGFARLGEALRRAGLHPSDFLWPPSDDPDRPPYRGLRPLEEADAGIFFGRDASITKGLDALRRLRDGASERLVVVVGASGAGKSSFLRAGLLARLRRDPEAFHVLDMVRPERAPWSGPEGLENALGPLGPADRFERLAELRDAVTTTLASGDPPSRRPTLILPIDQGEELFSEGPEREVALRRLRQALDREPELRVVLTIRSDSLELLQSEPALEGVPLFLMSLPRMPAAAFKEVVVGPGRLADPPIEFDDDAVDRICTDMEAANALPLLAFTLQRLVADYGQDGRVTLDEYVRGLGGLGGAIARAVAEAFDEALRDPALPDDLGSLEALARRALVPWLVRLDDAEASPKRRVARLDELPEATRPLLDKLIAQRLLVSDVRDGVATIEVSHEAVLRHWPDLTEWIAAEREELTQAERLMRAAREWSAHGAGQDGLLVHRGERLDRAEALLRRDDLRGLVGESVVDYVVACRQREDAERATEAARLARQRRLQRWIGALLAVGLVATSVGGWGVLQGQREVGRARSEIIAVAAREAFDEGDYARGLRFGVLASAGAWHTAISSRAHPALAANAQEISLLADLRLEASSVDQATWFEDDTRIFTWSHDGIAQVWDARTGAPVGAAMEHGERIFGAVVRGNRILAWGEEGTTRQWDARTGAPIGDAMEHAVLVLGATFDSAMTRVLTWSHDGTARLWDASTGAALGAPMRHGAQVIGATFDADDARVLTWSQDGTAHLWDAQTGGPLGAPLTHDQPLQSATFTLDSTRVLTWSFDGTARLWDAATSDPVGSVMRHEAWVYDAIFDRAGDRILTWSQDHTARLWDAQTGAPIGAPMQHESWVVGARFDDEHPRVLTWSDDHTARLWSAETGAPLNAPLVHEASVFGALFDPRAPRILTWSDDGTARLWANHAELLGTLQHDAPVHGAHFDDASERVLTWSLDGSARLWDAASQQPLGSPMRHDGPLSGAAFDDDETRVLTWGKDGTARVWDAGNVQRLRHGGSVVHAVYLDAAPQVLSWALDGQARLWDAATGASVGAPMDHGPLMVGLAIDEGQNRVVTWGYDNIARLWDARTGEPVGPALHHDDPIDGALFDDRHDRVVTWGQDATARLWDARTGGSAGPPLGHGDRVLGATVDDRLPHLVTWSFDGVARLWDPRTGTSVGTPMKHGDVIYGALVSDEPARLLTWSRDGTARLWHAPTGAPLGAPLLHEDSVEGAMFDEASTRVLTWSLDGTVRLWDAHTAAPLAVMEHGDHVYGATFDVPQTRVLSWGRDGTARLWDASNGEALGAPLQHDAQVHDATFDDDNLRILTRSFGGARLWDATTGAPLGGPMRHDGAVSGARFDESFTRVVTWSADGTARLWDALTGEALGAPLRHAKDVSGATFDDERDRVLTWSEDGTVRLWDVAWSRFRIDPEAFVRRVCEERMPPTSRRLTRHDLDAAPILKGRRREDVCAGLTSR